MKSPRIRKNIESVYDIPTLINSVAVWQSDPYKFAYDTTVVLLWHVHNFVGFDGQ